MRKKNVLIVDDAVDMRVFLSALFRTSGFQTTAVKNGKEGIRKAREIQPDLILLDVMMPGMDGIELCRVIRGRAETGGTPVLILSARGDAESVMRGMDAGANDYLPKPILHHDLVATVRKMLDMNSISE